jgi:hypothetical protein
MATRLALPFHAAPGLLDRFSRTVHEWARISRHRHELAALDGRYRRQHGRGRAGACKAVLATAIAADRPEASRSERLAAWLRL